MKILWLLVFVTGATGASFDYDPSVCTPNTLPTAAPNPPPRPSFKDLKSFETRIEGNFLDKNATEEYVEYFDHTNNRGALTVYQSTQKFKTIYDYNTNEILITMPDQGVCMIEDLRTSANNFLFGYKNQSDTAHSFSASGALRFGQENVTEVYMGKETVRGIIADRWDSCIKWDNMRATIKLSWYFSDLNSWNTALGTPQTPLRAVVSGTISKEDGTLDHTFNHVYEFIQFRPYLAKDSYKHFETPKGIVCKGRKKTRPLPEVPIHFRASYEVISQELSIISHYTEYYDFDSQLTRFDYRPLQFPGAGSKFGDNELTEIHDFNTGVRYITDPRNGNCTVRPVDVTAVKDAVATDNQTVRMMSAKEFFQLDVDYVYTGVRKVRGMDADTWIGTKTNSPSPGINSTYEWYFTAKDWLADDKEGFQAGSPVMMSLNILDPINLHYTYNLYSFSRERPALELYDISSCYANLRHERLMFLLPGSYTKLVLGNLGVVKYAVVESITNILSISPLRVSQLTIDRDKTDENVVVTFLMLDAAPIKGNVKLQNPEVTFDAALNLLKSAVDTKTFLVQLLYPGSQKPVELTAVPGSLRVGYYPASSQATTTQPPTTAPRMTPATATTTAQPMSTKTTSKASQTPSSSDIYTTGVTPSSNNAASSTGMTGKMSSASSVTPSSNNAASSTGMTGKMSSASSATYTTTAKPSAASTCDCNAVEGSAGIDDKTVYSPGMVAAVASAMALVGILIGMAVVVFYNRRQGRLRRQGTATTHIHNPLYDNSNDPSF